MNIAYASGFIRQSRQLAPEIRQQLKHSIELFAENPLHPSLRNHPLKGKYKSHRSIDVTSDIRALYIQKGNEAIFVAVGTHNQLYGQELRHSSLIQHQEFVATDPAIA